MCTASCSCQSFLYPPIHNRDPHPFGFPLPLLCATAGCSDPPSLAAEALHNSPLCPPLAAGAFTSPLSLSATKNSPAAAPFPFCAAGALLGSPALLCGLAVMEKFNIQVPSDVRLGSARVVDGARLLSSSKMRRSSCGSTCADQASHLNFQVLKISFF
jgi:hypothetical protein